MYQPMYQPPHRSTGETLKSLFLSNLVLALGFAAGLVLMWIGALIYGWSNDTDVDKFGMTVQSLGVLALTLVMFLGGFIRSDIDMKVRYGMLLGGVLLVIFVGFWGPSIAQALVSLMN